MENDQMNGSDTTNIYLDFNGKLSSDVFQNQVFFRIANLSKKNPLVQVNDSLFKGTYDHTIGTNLFFEETDENTHIGNSFQKQNPTCLKYYQSSTKLLKLQQVKIPQSKAIIQNETTNINYNLNWDYNELLQKLENGTLKIEDILAGDDVLVQKMEVEEIEEGDNTQDEEPVPSPEYEVEHEQIEEIENKLEDIAPVKILEAEYAQLNILAGRPVRRAASPELVAECDTKFEKLYEYHNIERQILQPRDGFKSEVLYVDENTLSNCVDIDRCVLYGLIPESFDFPRTLTEEERKKLLTFENFDNLSLAGRYYVLRNLTNDLEMYVTTTHSDSLQEKDDYGRTPVETLEIFKKLTEAVKKRLQEIKLSLENEGYESN